MSLEKITGGRPSGAHLALSAISLQGLGRSLLLLGVVVLIAAGCQKQEQQPEPEAPATSNTAVAPEPPAASTASPPAKPATDATAVGKVQVVKLGMPGREDNKESRAGLPKRWLGITVANMKEPIPGAPEDCRTQVQRAMRGSPAHKAGLRRGDVIVAASDQPVKRFQDYLAEARKVEVGELLQLQLLREGRPFAVALEMIARPDNMPGWRRRSFPGTQGFDFALPSLRPADRSRVHVQAESKPQLVYFWATWCGPCRQLAPQIEQLYRDAGNALSLVAISSEEEVVIRRHLKSSTTTYPVAHDLKGELKLDYEVSKLPTAVLVGADGRIISWDYGLGGVRKVVLSTRQHLGL